MSVRSPSLSAVLVVVMVALFCNPALAHPAKAKARLKSAKAHPYLPPKNKVLRKGKQKSKTKRSGNLAEFFAGSPLRGSGLKVRRSKSQPRKTSL